MLDPKTRKEIEEIMEQYEGAPLDVINAALRNHADKQNNTPKPDFDGLTSNQMFGLVHFDCDENMIRLKTTSGEKSPIIIAVKYLLNIIKDNKETKLTKTGALPRAIVKDIYTQQILYDPIFKFHIKQVYDEKKNPTVEVVDIICLLAGLTKKRNNKLSLTKKGAALLEANQLFKPIFIAYCRELNWAYFDYYEDVKLGQFGCYYSIYLLNKYGSEKQTVDFYANKYFKAWFKDYIGINTEYSYCYRRRTFNKFLDFFGFLEHLDGNDYITQDVKKSSLFDEYISIADGNIKQIPSILDPVINAIERHDV